jgi:hypothetical protein
MMKRHGEPASLQSLNGFATCPVQQGCLFDLTNTALPSRLHGYVGSAAAEYGTDVSTTFGIVQSGEVSLRTREKRWHDLSRGYYFSVPGRFSLEGEGSAALFERVGYLGTFTLAGPIEALGRLTYIDGCSDSLLVYPPRMGDPCMNVLWFPEGVRQTMHIHPTMRLALVVAGEGRCVMPSGEIPLMEGNVFSLRPMEQHCFFTEKSRMGIVTYHPDTNWGPSDADHPMINRTLMAGASPS